MKFGHGSSFAVLAPTAAVFGRAHDIVEMLAAMLSEGNVQLC